MFTRARKKGRFTNGLSGAYIRGCVSANKTPSTVITFKHKIGEPEKRIQENIRELVEKTGCINECITSKMTKEELLQFEKENGLKR